MSRAQKKASKAAIELINRLGIKKAPVDVKSIASFLNIKIKYTPENNTEVSGFFYREGGSSVIGVNFSQSSERQRFTIAHEIGHAILHNMQGLHVDKKYRNSVSSQGTSLEEIEANAFAAELLMPEEFIRREAIVHTLLDMVEAEEPIKQLAKTYGVSAQAMTIRLSNLGCL